MYCTQCGIKLSDTAKFCTNCGAKIASAETDIQELLGAKPVGDVAAELVSEELPVAPTHTSRSSLKESLIEFRRTTLKAVPTFVLAILAFLAATGTAYAAFKVVTEVVIPAIEQIVASVPNRGDAPVEETSTAPVEPKNETEAASIVRLSEFLTGNPDDVIARIDDLGLTYESLRDGEFVDGKMAPVRPEDPYSFYPGIEAASSAVRVMYPDADSDAWEALLNVGIYDRDWVENHDNPFYAPGIYFGSGWCQDRATYLDETNSHVCSADELVEQDAFNSVALCGLPFNGMDDNKLVEFQKIVGLQGEGAIYRPFRGEGAEEAIATNKLTVNGVEYLVYFELNPGGEMGSTLGAIPWEEAATIVSNGALYSQEEFNAATFEQQLGIVAQSLIQSVTESNGGFRTNLRTGAYERGRSVFEEDTRAYRLKWVPVEDQIDPSISPASVDASDCNIVDYTAYEE